MDIISLRLASHWLNTWWFSDIETAVRHIGCMQSQDIHQATRAVGSRVPWSTKQDVKQALIDGKIVRTRPMRGTLHYVAPENIHRMLDLCASKTLNGFAKRRDFLWISDKFAEKALEIIDNALRGGKYLTRTQLGQTLQDWWVPMQTQRVYHLACYAATRKLICFGPPTEKEETFVLLDQRASNPLKLNQDEQLATLATMYLTGHGPATVDDLARRSGLGKTLCKQAIASITDQCEVIQYNDKTYYSIPLSQKTIQKDTLLLLPWFDEYFLWYKDRSIVADTTHYEKMFTKNGIFFPLIVQNGRVVWVWKRSWKKDACIFDIQLLPGEKIDKTQLEKAAHEYAAFHQIYHILINWLL